MAEKKTRTENALAVLDSITNILALVVSLIAIFIATNSSKNLQTRAEKFQKGQAIQHNRPLLQIEYHNSDHNDISGLVLKNFGHGTAEITDFRYYLNLEDRKKDLPQSSWIANGALVVDKNIDYKKTFGYEHINWLSKSDLVSNKEEGDIYLLGTERYLLDKGNDGKEKNRVSFYNSETAKQIDKIIIEIEYKSIFEGDSTTYFLGFCPSCQTRNYRKRGIPSDYSKPQPKQIKRN